MLYVTFFIDKKVTKKSSGPKNSLFILFTSWVFLLAFTLVWFSLTRFLSLADERKWPPRGSNNFGPQGFAARNEF